MRKLAWAALPYAAAVFLAHYLLPVRGLPFFAAALFSVALAALVLRGDTRRRVMTVCLAAAIGFGAYAVFWASRVRPCEAFDGETRTAHARVTDYTEYRDGYSRVRVRMTEPGLPHIKAQMLSFDEELPELQPGDEITVTARLSVEEKSYIADGDILCGYVQEAPERTGRWTLSWLYAPKGLNRALQDACDRIFSADTAPLIKAMMTGDKFDLSRQARVYSAMQISGVAHIVAVSGMHMMFLVSVLQLVLGKGKRTSLLCIPVIVLFVLMTGAQASVIRAAVLQFMLLLAPLFDRESDGVTSLSFALVLLLVRNPAAIGSISLQLSFASAAGLILLVEPLQTWRKRHFRHSRIFGGVLDSLVCTVAATAFSMPIAAYYFGTVPLLSALVNILTLNVLEFVFIAGYVLCALNVFAPAAAVFLGTIPSFFVRICEWIFTKIASLPFACAYTENPGVVLWLVILYGLMIAVFIGRRRGRSWRYITPAACSVVLLCAVLAFADIHARHCAGVSVLDVGQGQCVALYDGDAAVVVDCGGTHTEKNAGSTAACYLGGCGRKSVDILILTHLHDDHANGVAQLMYRIPVRQLIYYEDCGDDDAMMDEIRLAAAETGTEICPVSEEGRIMLGDMSLDLSLPLSGEGENERGIAVGASIRGRNVLITGDLGSEGELALVEKGRAAADILVAGHHGSRYSSCALFLEVLEPQYACVSVGENSYGHPAEETLQRLSAHCENVCRTDLDGDIKIRIR